MKMKVLLIVAALTLASLTAWSLTKPSSYKNVGVDEFEKLISNKKVQILDSRTKAEYEQGHLEGAVLIDVNDPSFLSMAKAALDKRKEVAVYCRSGRRSRVAADILSKNGYKVTNLDGGILSWNEAKKATVK